jgi:hypothetical protein
MLSPSMKMNSASMIAAAASGLIVSPCCTATGTTDPAAAAAADDDDDGGDVGSLLAAVPAIEGVKELASNGRLAAAAVLAGRLKAMRT